MIFTMNLDVNNHLFMNIRVANNRTELIEGNLAILVFVGETDRLVNYLLKLSVLQVVSHHHFQHLKQLAIRDESVVIHIVDSESKLQLR